LIQLWLNDKTGIKISEAKNNVCSLYEGIDCFLAKIIAINAGSSSLKFQLFEMPEEHVIAKGLIERIGLNDSNFTITVHGKKQTYTLDIPNHATAVIMLLDKLTATGMIKSLNEIEGVGHRVVHGGELFHDSALVTDGVLEQIEGLSELAPLHNPANLTGIIAFRRALPDVPAVVVFDTAFHQTMPESSFLYSLPYEY
jgi:acetate kinase